MNCIAAADLRWGIGKDGKLLAHIPEDLRFFKRMTAGKVVVMGRKTLESLPGGRPLSDRVNIVLTRDSSFKAEGAEIVHSVEEALEALSPYDSADVFVIGGGSIYRSFLPYCDTAYITRIEYSFDADTHFPDLEADGEWELAEKGEKKTQFDLIYSFDVYRRKGAAAVKGQRKES